MKRRTGDQIPCFACAKSESEADNVSKYHSKTWERRKTWGIGLLASNL